MIDYSAPNVAKEMHVGHLRSTVIGDALARVLDFVGHEVLRENHIGDWGTPFGMLIEHLVDLGGSAEAESFSVRDLNEFYAQARVQFDSDPDFAERSSRRVVLLQGGDPETLRLWRIFVAESLRHNDEIYSMLGVLLTDDDVVGESFYNPLLPVVVEELAAEGLLVEHERRAVFPQGFENRNGDPLPADRAQVRRGVRLPGHGLGVHTRPHRSPGRHAPGLRRRCRPVAALPAGLRRGGAGRIPSGPLGRRPRRVRARARSRRQEDGQPLGQLGEADRSSHRRRGPRLGFDRRAAE